jgi:hypothetical protein
MPKVRMLAPGADKDGNVLSAGAVVDVDDETAAALRADGKASLIEDEEAQAKAAEEGGNYTARTGRPEVAGQPQEPPPPEPPKAEEPKKR